jgi:prolyl-tRNA synthetase
MSQLFSQTLRDVPSEADVNSHQLLLRAGYIRQLAAGIFTYMPLARRTLNKIENIMRKEIEQIGGQEITMPVVHPAELWQETGRWYEIGDEMGRFVDRTGRHMVLGMTHEEVIADLVRKEIRSYRQLPSLIYHIQTKWRDDPRPRAGLIRVREFTMKDSYSLDKDWAGLERQYRAHYQAYFNIFNRCGLDVLAIRSDVGMMGGKIAHEFMYLTPIGEDTIMICDRCGYKANRQVAVFSKQIPEVDPALPIEKVATPDCKSIEQLANFLNIPESQTAKAVFMIATIPAVQKSESGSQHGPGEMKELFIFAIIRGDMDINETKLANAIHAVHLRPATDDEIRSVGAVPGYASPVGLDEVYVIVDNSIPTSPNLVAGANEEGYHLRNVNFGRDFTAQQITDIATAQDGYPCEHCKSPLRIERGVEVGNIFQLGTRYTEALGARYQDQDGNSKPIFMGSYGIGSGRLLACIAEAYHDENGLSLPISVAPYQVHLILLVGKAGQEQVPGGMDPKFHLTTIDIS